MSGKGVPCGGHCEPRASGQRGEVKRSGAGAQIATLRPQEPRGRGDIHVLEYKNSGRRVPECRTERGSGQVGREACSPVPVPCPRPGQWEASAPGAARQTQDHSAASSVVPALRRSWRGVGEPSGGPADAREEATGPRVRPARRRCPPLLLSPGAWIITGGSHAGVMKQVGEAVRDFTLSSCRDEGDIVTVGIATWGTVHNREGLIHPSVSSAAPLGCGSRSGPDPSLAELGGPPPGDAGQRRSGAESH